MGHGGRGGAAVGHRLQDAFLGRLATHPDADGVVVRGGARIRRLRAGRGRTARDVDLVCAWPYSPPAIEARLRAILGAERAHPDVRFDVDQVRVTPLWRPRFPGFLAHAPGEARGVAGVLVVDLVFGLPLGPAPARDADGLQLARRETLIARKVRVITQLGRAGWRPKDLADLACLVGDAADGPIDRDALDASFEAAFADGPDQLGDARDVFGRPGWWDGDAAERRWRRFAGGGPDVRSVADRVGRALAPSLAATVGR